jgi:hypothetical protein
MFIIKSNKFMSSIRYELPDVIGCVFFNKSRDLNEDLKKLIEKIWTKET